MRRRSWRGKPRRSPSQAAVARKFSHRTHPCKIYRTPPGVCRWCSADILKADGTLNRRRTFCGQLCTDAYLLHTDSKTMRRYVWHRDRGICRECGIRHPLDSKTWEADHILPLFISCGDWNFWSPDNVQILCIPCHKIKTQADRIKYRP